MERLMDDYEEWYKLSTDQIYNEKMKFLYKFNFKKVNKEDSDSD